MAIGVALWSMCWALGCQLWELAQGVGGASCPWPLQFDIRSLVGFLLGGWVPLGFGSLSTFLDLLWHNLQPAGPVGSLLQPPEASAL